MRRAALALIAAVLLLASGPAQALEILVGLPYGKHTIGHTAVRVRSFDDSGEVIYDFGRYGKTWGYLGLHGEGVMRVWRGPKAVARYLAKQTTFRDSVGFTVQLSEDEERRIYLHYQQKLEGARWVKPYPLHTRYRLNKDYHGVTNQCTSVALEGLKAVWPRARWEALLPSRFDKGQGFPPATHDYFFKIQKELGIAEVVVPLDVLDALRAARQAMPEVVVEVRDYPRHR